MFKKKLVENKRRISGREKGKQEISLQRKMQTNPRMLLLTKSFSYSDETDDELKKKLGNHLHTD